MNRAAARNISERDQEYLRDESRMVGYAEKISFPETEEEILDALLEAKASGMPITIQGSRTGITGAAVPQGGQILSLLKYNRITGMEKKDGKFFVKVQAGVSLEQLNTVLRSKQTDTNGWTEESRKVLEILKKAKPQFFPPAPTEETATLGGMFACNAAGISAGFYGKTTDFVEQIKWLLADGEVWDITRGSYTFDNEGCMLPNGKKLEIQVSTKKAKGFALLQPYAGMDLIDYLAGSEGMLGMALSMKLRLEPEPEDQWGTMCFFRDWRKALDFAASLLEQEAPITAIEFFDQAALDFVEDLKKDATKLREIPDIPGQAQSAVYFVLAADSQEKSEEILMQILELLAECGGEEEWTWAGNGRDEMEKFRLFRHAVPEAVNRRLDENRLNDPELIKMGLDCSAPETYLKELVENYLCGLEESGIAGTVFGHVPQCHLHVNLLPRDEQEKERARKMIAQWEGQIRQWGGCTAEENGIGKVKKRIVSALSEKEKENIARAKAYFDPNGRWNPGNMVETEEWK